MIANTNHIIDYNLVHRYLCGDEKAGQELYASIFPTASNLASKAEKPSYQSFLSHFQMCIKFGV